jgi:hypothetical protein
MNIQLKHKGLLIAFRTLIAKICILLFFRILASKLEQLLITDNATKTNRIQMEFYSNGAIASQELASYSKLFAKLTNLFKQNCVKLPSPFGEGLGVRFHAAKIKKRTGAWPIPFFTNPSPVFPQGLHRAITQRTVR